MSKNCPGGFCATGDLVSVCSFAFLDGLAGLHLKLTVTLHLGRQRDIKTGGEAVIADIPMQSVSGEKGTVQVFSEDSMCSYSRILEKKIFASGGWCFVER